MDGFGLFFNFSRMWRIVIGWRFVCRDFDNESVMLVGARNQGPSRAGSPTGGW